MNKTIVCCLLIAAMTLVALTPMAPLSAASGAKIVAKNKIVTLNKTGRNNKLTIKISYPQIGQTKIDQAIKSWAETTADDFYKAWQQDSSLGWQKLPDYENVIKFKVYQVGTNLISIVFEGYGYTGGAHGLPTFKAFNYRLDDGQELKLKDIFSSQTDYLKLLWQHSEPQLITASKSRGASTEQDALDWIREGSQPKDENYQNYYFTNDSLIVHFGSYQVGPYAIGQFNIPIRWSLLRPQLDNSFVNNLDKQALFNKNFSNTVAKLIVTNKYGDCGQGDCRRLDINPMFSLEKNWVIEAIYSGIADDSISSERVVVSAKYKDSLWQLDKELSIDRVCQPGRGHEYFDKAPCQ